MLPGRGIRGVDPRRRYPAQGQRGGEQMRRVCCSGGDRSGGCGAGLGSSPTERGPSPLRVRLVFSTDHGGCEVSVERGGKQGWGGRAEPRVLLVDRGIQPGRETEAAPWGWGGGGLSGPSTALH